jgi:hypothetical protein
MLSPSRTIAAGLFLISGCLFAFVADARGQERRQAMPGILKQPMQPQGMQQPGVMQRGMMPQQSPQGRQTPTASRGETYGIVEVGHELQIVSKPSGLKDLKKRLEDEYKSANKAYQDAKKDKNNKGVTLPKPEKKTIKEIKSGIKTQEKAQEELMKLQADRDRGGDKKSRR